MDLRRYEHLRKDFKKYKDMAFFESATKYVAKHTIMIGDSYGMLLDNVGLFINKWERYCLVLACYEAIHKGEYTQLGQIVFAREVYSFILDELKSDVEKLLGKEV